MSEVVQSQGAVQNPLGPRALGDIFRDTFGIYRRNFLKISAVVAIYAVPTTILSSLLSMLAVSLPSDPRRPDLVLGAACLLLVAELAFLLLLLPFTIWGSGAIIHAVSTQMLGAEIKVRESYRFAWRRLPSLLGAALLFGLAIIVLVIPAVVLVVIAVALGVSSYREASSFACLAFLGFLIFFVVFIYVAVRWYFYQPAIVLERADAMSALSRSATLVKGNWWRVFGIILGGGIVLVVIGLAVGIPFAIASEGVDFALGARSVEVNTPLGLLISSLGSLLRQVLAGSIFPIWLTLLYFDLRVRREGYNQENLSKELGLSASPMRPA